MNKGYQYNPTLTEILWAIVKLIRALLSLLSPRLAERFYSFCSKYLLKEEMLRRGGVTPPLPTIQEEAKIISPPEVKFAVTNLPQARPVITPSPTPEVKRPYIDRGPLLPEHYGEDKIIALVRDPHCIFVYWDLHGFKSQEMINYHKGPKYWSLRVHRFGEDAYHDVPINIDTRNWYLWVADDKSYIIDLGFSTPHGEFFTIVSSNPVQTPRAGTSQEYAEYWGFIFSRISEAHPLFPTGIAWAPPGGRWYEGWFEAHAPGSPILQTQKKGQGK